MAKRILEQGLEASSVPDTMSAIVQTRYGSDAADVLRVGERPTPTPGPGEVLVRVAAAGVDRGTWHLMTGEPLLIRLMGFGFGRPKSPVPGLDLAGTVVGVAPDVAGFRPGDEVYGFGAGSFAEFALARADQLAPKPATISFEQAAVVPLCGITALQALRDVAHVRAGERVLVLGASGGVGTFAVQLAKAFGARVTGVCSTAKGDLVHSLGAEEILDYTVPGFLDGAGRYDVILDIGGSSRLRRLRRALTPMGRLVIVGGEQGGTVTNGFGRQLRAPLLSLVSRQRLTMVVNKKRSSDLEVLRGLIEGGAVVPALDRSYPLDQASDAMRHLVGGAARGKVAITVRS